ncbi:uncharacterized protein N7515_003825 [Penicillium bovifimosum]|uniref:Uncharacterized protein n=1 Tax=Penicillium bovifimosum TaxID=126998 RepID=A0A9W9H5D9_9EURO|nr:uncharacterized protein N7515_003825 [Penicillium bovifimosum]KAJ5138977.1 hypothetical protein N7515_003825 [Penicillium bovifimosum]
MSESAPTNGVSAGQGATDDHNGQPQTRSAGSESTGSPNTSENTHDSPERREQIRQQELRLNYYRKFLEDLVGFMRDAQSESVADLVALIRSGASDEEILVALERVKEEN